MCVHIVVHFDNMCPPLTYSLLYIHVYVLLCTVRLVRTPSKDRETSMLVQHGKGKYYMYAVHLAFLHGL